MFSNPLPSLRPLRRLCVLCEKKRFFGTRRWAWNRASSLSC